MGGQRLVLMGRASGAFGIRGEIKIFFFGQDPKVLGRAGLIYVGPNPEAARPLTVLSVRRHGGRVLLTAREVATREQAALLGGSWVYLPQETLPALKEGEYYWYQLKGALVKGVDGTELGRVKEIADLGAHDLLLVRAGDGKEALIPVVEGVVLELDPARGLIVVDPPPGLLESQGWPEAQPEGTGHDL